MQWLVTVVAGVLGLLFWSRNKTLSGLLSNQETKTKADALQGQAIANGVLENTEETKRAAASAAAQQEKTAVPASGADLAADLDKRFK